MNKTELIASVAQKSDLTKKMLKSSKGSLRIDQRKPQSR